MNAFVIAALLLVLLTLSYQIGWSRSRNLATNAGERLHSRPIYHGVLVALFAVLPAVIVLGLWAMFSDAVASAFIVAQLPPETAQLSSMELQSAVARIEAIATGVGIIGEPTAQEAAAARAFETFQLVSFLAVVGAAETTKLGVIPDMLRFFAAISPLDFFFGTTWNPRFQSSGTGAAGEYGLLPLLWGTIMISLIAMLVAVPIGLLSAIYLSQYAHPRVRSIVKPIIEVLAGIPTIV